MSALSHILAREPSPSTPTPTPSSTSTRPAEAQAPPPAEDAGESPTPMPTPMPPKRKAEVLDDDSVATPKADSGDKNDGDTNAENNNGDNGDEPMYTATTTSTRTNKNGATSSVYSGNKIRHLKKEDGIPLWRKDIQYDFLKLVFYDQTQCFTKYSDSTKGHTFADIYIDAMAKSSKCSKILKEKLLQDQEGAISMAMVCLLVNVGRMNTTLNFFPEMRAQLRTYHSIPALQAHQDPNAYKQLQDAPRLKSILKGATEDEPQPSTMEDIKTAPIPRTNPVNLIFVMSQYAPKISEVHFPPPRDFFDLVMRSSLSSESRAKAFLWLIWWYLESDFSAEDSQRNPFGPGQYGEGEDETNAKPFKVPSLESLTELQAAEENVDTETEVLFGEQKRKERISILASEPSPAMTALKRARKEKGLTTGHNPMPSDDEGSETGYHRAVPTSVGRSALHHETGSEYTRSPSPAVSRGFQAVNAKPSGMGINNLLNSDDAAPEPSPSHATPTAPPAKKGPGRGNWRRNKNKDANATSAGAAATPVPLLPNTGQMQFVNNGPVSMSKPGQGSFSYGNNTLAAATGMSPGQNISFQSPATARDHIPTPSYQAQKRHRGVTQHQSAVINHRKMQIDYTLDRKLRHKHNDARYQREQVPCIVRAWIRIRSQPSGYDSEEEAIKIRKAKDRVEKNDEHWGSVRREKENDEYLENIEAWRRPKVLYAGFVRRPNEETDAGEEAKSLAQSFRRCSRRLERWQDTSLPGAAIMNRRQLEAQGMLRRAGRVSRKHSMAHEELDIMDDGPPTAEATIPRKRSGGAKLSTRREQTEPEEHKMDVDPEPDDEDGGAELDEEDRELLGEVDADEDEDEDEDDEMED